MADHADPADLALVINDRIAPFVLGWWDKTRPSPIDIDALRRLAHASAEEVEASVDRCRIAGLLLEGGIAPVARKWLGAYVAGRIGAKPTPKKVT